MGIRSSWFLQRRGASPRPSLRQPAGQGHGDRVFTAMEPAARTRLLVLMKALTRV